MEFLRRLTVPQAIALSVLVLVVLIAAVILFDPGGSDEVPEYIATRTPSVNYNLPQGDEGGDIAAPFIATPVGPIDFGRDG